MIGQTTHPSGGGGSGGPATWGEIVGTLTEQTDLNNRFLQVENKHVRATRFAEIGSGTSGTIAIPANNSIVLDDFGGTVDAIISESSGGRPTFVSARTATGELIATSFDASGNYSLSGTPAAYPVCLIYRTRCSLKNFDDTSSDIVGDYEIEQRQKYRRLNLTAAQSPFTLPELSEGVIVAVDLNFGNVVLNLPLVSSAQEGVEVSIYVERNSANTNTLTINAAETDTIRGQTSVVMRMARDGIHLYPHTYLNNHWDALNWERTDEIIYNPGNAGVTSITNLQKLLDYQLSSGQISGCAITKNGDGTINVAEGEWKLRIANTSSADCRVYKVPAAGPLSPVDNATSYLVISYNGGSPAWSITSDISNVPCTDSCLQAIILRRGTQVDFLYLGDYTTDFPARYAKAKSVTAWLEYGDGLQVAEVPTRRFSVSAGSLYQGTLRFTTQAFNTNTGSTFEYWYRNGVGGWTVTTNQTDIDNLNFDDGDGILGVLDNNKFGVHWVYVLVDNPSRLAVVYGQGNYANLAEARAAGIPSVLPPFASKFSLGKLVAKIIIQKSAATFADIQSPFSQVFSSTTPVDHDSLSGLKSAGTGVTFGHITDQAQTIAGVKTFAAHPVSTDPDTPAGDETIPVSKLGQVIAAAATKATPVDADSFGYSDSAASGAFKKTTWANIKATLNLVYAQVTKYISISETAGVFSNCYVSGTRTNRTSTTETGAAIECHRVSTNTSPTYLLWLNLVNDGTTTASKIGHMVTANGVHTFGYAGAAGSVRHTFYGSATASDETVEICKSGMTANTANNYYMSFSVTKGSGFDGFLQTNGSGVLSIVDSSDERKKENIKDMADGLDIIKKLKPKVFDWKTGAKKVRGFVAQDVKTVLPESVVIHDETEIGGNSDAHYLETKTMIPVLVAAVKELTAKVEALEKQVKGSS